MSTKINPSIIVIDHFKTLRQNQIGKILFDDILIFFLLPILLSLLLLIFGQYLNDNLITIFVTSLSIFAALLFNLLLLIFDIVNKEDHKNDKSTLKIRYLKEIYSNISYSILISIIAIIALLVAYIDIPLTYLNFVLGFISYTLIIQFLLTLFMVLKRVHILLSKEFQNGTM